MDIINHKAVDTLTERMWSADEHVEPGVPAATLVLYETRHTRVTPEELFFVGQDVLAHRLRAAIEECRSAQAAAESVTSTPDPEQEGSLFEPVRPVEGCSQALFDQHWARLGRAGDAERAARAEVLPLIEAARDQVEAARGEAAAAAMDPVRAGAELEQLLAVLGWSGGHLAERLGCHRNLPPQWISGRVLTPPNVLSWLRDLVARVAHRPPPSDWRARRPG